MTNITLEDEIAKIRDLATTQPDGWVAHFEQEVARVSSQHGAEAIPLLLSLLNDDSEYFDVLFSVVHAVESHHETVYLDGLLQASGNLRRSAPRWLEILYMRVLNSPPTRENLLRRTLSEETRGDLRALAKKRPQFSDAVSLLVAKKDS